MDHGAIRRPHLILGHLDGVMTGVAQYPHLHFQIHANGTTQVTNLQGLTIRLPALRNVPSTLKCSSDSSPSPSVAHTTSSNRT